MKTFRVAFAAALFLLSASGACAPGAVDASAAPGLSVARAAAPEDPAIHDDPALCEAAGGTLKPRGMMAVTVCVRPYADAGQVCRDKADCLGACVSSGDKDPAGADLGLCQRETDMAGCFAEVRDGRAQPVLCAD